MQKKMLMFQPLKYVSQQWTALIYKISSHLEDLFIFFLNKNPKVSGYFGVH